MNYYSKGTLADGVRVERLGFGQWIATDGLTADEGIAERCNESHVAAALAGLEGVRVLSTSINRTGVYDPPQERWDADYMPVMQITDLPDYAEVLVGVDTPGGHTAHLLVWVPLAWNERYLATGGMGSVTGPLWFDAPTVRTMTMHGALRNGFATSATDGGNRDKRFTLWPLDPETGALDWELLRNWSYRSTHDMAVVSKVVIEALTGAPPSFSYFAGCSGGGRQVMESAQRYPEDFDGRWAADAVIDWNRFWVRSTWAAIVQKEYDNPLAVAKLDAFRAAAIEKLDGQDGLRDGVVGAFDNYDFDPFDVVGTETAAGVITAKDAEVMQKIYDGAVTPSGEQISGRLRPTMVSWGVSGIIQTREEDGRLVSSTFDETAHYRWIAEDSHFDWRTLDLASFAEMSLLGVEKFAEFDAFNPDLRPLQASGGKVLLTQAADDEVVPFETTVKYLQNVNEVVGDAGEVADFFRVFISDGDQHGILGGSLPGVSRATAMTALMNWVENGEAPDELVGEKVNMMTGEILSTRPVFAYPNATRYSGSGDPAQASSYISAPIS